MKMKRRTTFFPILGGLLAGTSKLFGAKPASTLNQNLSSNEIASCIDPDGNLNKRQLLELLFKKLVVSSGSTVTKDSFRIGGAFHTTSSIQLTQSEHKYWIHLVQTHEENPAPYITLSASLEAPQNIARCHAQASIHCWDDNDGIYRWSKIIDDTASVYPIEVLQIIQSFQQVSLDVRMTQNRAFS